MQSYYEFSNDTYSERMMYVSLGRGNTTMSCNLFNRIPSDGNESHLMQLHIYWLEVWFMTAAYTIKHHRYLMYAVVNQKGGDISSLRQLP